MKLKETLEIFEIEERRGGVFRIIKQPSTTFLSFRTSCGWYIRWGRYPDFYICADYIAVYLRGLYTSRNLRRFKVPSQYIQNFKQSIKEFCEKMNWELVVSSDEYIGII